MVFGCESSREFSRRGQLMLTVNLHPQTATAGNEKQALSRENEEQHEPMAFYLTSFDHDLHTLRTDQQTSSGTGRNIFQLFWPPDTE